MYLKMIDEENYRLVVAIPLTTTSWKTRVKTRSSIFEYGLPHASRREQFTQANYIERQIGYDVVLDDEEKLKLTTLPEKHFVAYNGKNKALYELSEYLYYFYQRNIISDPELKDLLVFLKGIHANNLIDNHPDCSIRRTHPCEKNIFGISFYKSEISYPLLIHKFENYEIITEISIREKQRAIWVQPMLYFCFPITELVSEPPLIWRIANIKEEAGFVFDRSNYHIILEMTRIFWLLSQSHNYDIIRIIESILD